MEAFSHHHLLGWRQTPQVSYKSVSREVMPWIWQGYISVSLNDVNLFSSLTPVNHKGESQLFYPTFLLFLTENVDCSNGPNLLRIFPSEASASKYTETTTTQISQCDLQPTFQDMELNQDLAISNSVSDWNEKAVIKMHLVQHYFPPALRSSIHGFSQASVLTSLLA